MPTVLRCMHSPNVPTFGECIHRKTVDTRHVDTRAFLLAFLFAQQKRTCIDSYWQRCLSRSSGSIAVQLWLFCCLFCLQIHITSSLSLWRLRSSWQLFRRRLGHVRRRTLQTTTALSFLFFRVLADILSSMKRTRFIEKYSLHREILWSVCNEFQTHVATEKWKCRNWKCRIGKCTVQGFNYCLYRNVWKRSVSLTSITISFM